MKAKKLISLALALMLALSCVSFTALADTTELSETVTISSTNYDSGNMAFTGNTDICVGTYNLKTGGDCTDLSDTKYTVSLTNDNTNNKNATHHLTKVVVNGTDLTLGNYGNPSSITVSGTTYTMSATNTKAIIVSGSAGKVSSITAYYAPDAVPTLSFTAATTAPEFVEGTAKTASVGTVAAANFTGTVTYTAKVYTTADGTDEAAGITAAVDGTALKVTTTDAVVNGTYYVSLSGKYDTESAALSSRVPVKVYGTFLDLEADATYPDSDTVEQLYTASVTTNKTDVTKVQVSWTLEKISVSVTNNKIWNTETLSWEVDTSKTNGATASDPTATFNFVNLSSKDVYAKLTFAKASGFKTEPEKTFTDNDVAGDGIIKLGNKATDSTTDNTGKIKLALTVTDSDFDEVAQGTDTYGTYTVTISAKDPTEYTVTFDKQEGTGGTDSIKVVSGGQLTNITVPTKAGYTFVGYFTGTSDTDPMWYKADGTPNVTDPITADQTLYARWDVQE